MKRLLLLLLLLPALAACSVTSHDADPGRYEVRELTEAEKAVVAADNRFGFELLRVLAGDDPGGNVFISPISVSMALGMTANGAGGDTYDAMIRTLGKEYLDPTQVNQSYRELRAMLQGLDPKVAVEIANSIWYRQGYPVLPAFLDAGRTWFDADIEGLDFAEPASVDRINGWADEKTHGLIDQVIERIEPDVVMYLMNAIYFKGAWQYAFDPDDTVDGPFTNADGTVSTLPMMALEADLPVLITDRFRAFELPYGDSLFSMTVVVPSGTETAHALVQDLDQDAWSAWAAQFRTARMRIALPRFRTEYKASLKPALASLGMEPAFDPSVADFSRLVEGGGPWIDDVIHQAVVIVNEEGTEAAAVTTVIIIETSVGPEIRVDRPFLFLIRERVTGTILFAGLINTLS